MTWNHNFWRGFLLAKRPKKKLNHGLGNLKWRGIRTSMADLDRSKLRNWSVNLRRAKRNWELSQKQVEKMLRLRIRPWWKSLDALWCKWNQIERKRHNLVYAPRRTKQGSIISKWNCWPKVKPEKNTLPCGNTSNPTRIEVEPQSLTQKEQITIPFEVARAQNDSLIRWIRLKNPPKPLSEKGHIKNTKFKNCQIILESFTANNTPLPQTNQRQPTILWKKITLL